ncbi:MAG: UDP-glucose 4-epimerase GalE [Piscirickettsiaceae bacterium]|nr:UDP-glucose 4-epimerase GalE [Piscirickettsiaceae bacterium]
MVLVTGGAGYIGSHICVELLDDGYDVIVVDNLSNSCDESLHRVQKITGKTVSFYQQDLRDKDALIDVFNKHEIKSVIHLAGYKAVGESCEKPLMYYQNNLESTLVLLDVMMQFDVNKLVFSSSAAVYGAPESVPISENFPLSTTNPYGRSKLIIEEILRDVSAVPSSNLQVILLRYFNPAGAHESGMIGEDPSNIPNNLLPYVSQVAVGKLKQVAVFGGDYQTKDGTGVRDYIHIVDLARGHLKALERKSAVNCEVYNLGTGRGYSVLEVIDAFQKVSQQDIPYEIMPRRDGDVAECYANSTCANKELGWQANKTLMDMVTDAWRWQSDNPEGYGHD